jgi:Ca2+-binding RTX toxin-like protein
MKLHKLTAAEYATLRYQFIKEFEGEETAVYNDGVGLPTIGIGFNLTIKANLKVVIEFGFGVTDPDELREAVDTMAIAVADAEGKTTAKMQEILDAAWQTYKNDSNAVFEIKDAAVGDTASEKIAAIFNKVLLTTGDNPGYETIITNKMKNVGIDDFSLSRERIALLSLQYGGNKLVDMDLRNNIVGDNRFEVFYQIRYQSNGGTEFRGAVAKRRYAEATLFGLFSSTTANQSEAKATVDGFITNLNDIQKYEDEFGSKIVIEANKNLKNITSVSLTAETVGELLKPATGYILERFNPENSAIDLTQFTHTIDGDVLLGIINKQTGEIASVNLNIIGKDKNDLLIAVENKANTLNGGLGDDVLIGNAGIDKLIGGDGTDTLLGGAGIDVLIGGKGDDYLDGGTGSDTMSGGKGNDTYIVDNAGDVVIEKDGEGNADKIISSVSFTLSSLQKNNIEILQLAEPEQTTQQANASAPNFLNEFNRVNALAAVNNQSVLTLTGNEFDNTLIGNSVDNILLGGGAANDVDKFLWVA